MVGLGEAWTHDNLSSFILFRSIYDDYIISLAGIVLWWEIQVTITTIIIITSPFRLCVLAIIVPLSMFVLVNESELHFSLGLWTYVSFLAFHMIYSFSDPSEM